MDYSDIGDIRRDALRRTREMHRQNMRFPDDRSEPVQDIRKETESGSVRNTSAPSNRDKKRNGGLNGALSGFFSDGKLDNDKIIIIALIVILAREGADLKLLIALGYILM